jgi:hypothetical protein
MQTSTAILIAIVAFLIGRRIGWMEAHLMIATECQRLGRFFVKKTVYHCTRIDWAHEEPEKEKMERTHGN